MALTAADETITPEGRPGLLIDWEMDEGRCETDEEVLLADQGSRDCDCDDGTADEGGDEWEAPFPALLVLPFNEARMADALMLDAWFAPPKPLPPPCPPMPPPLSAPSKLFFCCCWRCCCCCCWRVGWLYAELAEGVGDGRALLKAWYALAATTDDCWLD
jgi:hypothetical protein